MNPCRRTLLKLLAATGWMGSASLARVAYGMMPMPTGLIKAQGSVTVNGIEAMAGAAIKAGDTVVTGENAEAAYVVGQDAFLQRAATKVNFGAGGLRILTGGLLSAFGKGAKNIETPATVIGIRGTACYIEVETQRTYFCLCYGTAEVTPKQAPGEALTVTARHHDMPMYIYMDEKMEKKVVPAKMQDHTDDELTMLEALVGRKPPFLK